MAAETATVTVKTALAVAAVTALGPLLGQYALVLIGAFGGALLALTRAEPMDQWWRPVVHVAQGMIAAMLFASVVAAVLASILPESWGLPVDGLWIPVSAAVAMWWRDALDAARVVAFAWARKKGDQ